MPAPQETKPNTPAKPLSSTRLLAVVQAAYLQEVSAR